MASDLFITGEMKLDRSREFDSTVYQGPQREGIGREIAFGDGGAAPVQPAILDFAPIGVTRPAAARGDNVSMGVQGDRGAGTEAVPDDQVRGTDHSVGAYDFVGDGVFLDLEAQRLQLITCSGGMRRTVARRIVGRHPDKCLNHRHRIARSRVDDLVKPGVNFSGHDA